MTSSFHQYQAMDSLMQLRRQVGLYLGIKNDTHQGVCMRICLLCMYVYHVTMTPPSMRVGFKRLNLDSSMCTDYWRRFYGSSSEASFRHCIWRKIQQSVSSFTFTHRDVTQRITKWEKLGSADAPRPCLEKHTAIPAFSQTDQYQRSHKQSNTSVLTNRTIPAFSQTEQYQRSHKQSNTSVLTNRAIPAFSQTQQYQRSHKHSNTSVLTNTAIPAFSQTEQYQRSHKQSNTNVLTNRAIPAFSQTEQYQRSHKQSNTSVLTNTAIPAFSQTQQYQRSHKQQMSYP